MSDYRVTRQVVREDFARLCKMLGKRVAKSWEDVGAWDYEWHPEKGMVRVVELMDGGGTRNVLGDLYRTYREFHDATYFLEKALEGYSLGTPLDSISTDMPGG